LHNKLGLGYLREVGTHQTIQFIPQQSTNMIPKPHP
jgi:hypothetical protein